MKENEYKILVALDSSYIKEELVKIYKDRVYKFEFFEKEDVIEFLASSKDNYIVITKDNLRGKLSKELYIKQMKLAKQDIKIVYIVENLDKEYKEFLFANEVFNIIEGKVFSIDTIKEMIEQDSKVIYKVLDQNKKSTFDEPAVKYRYNQINDYNVESVPKELIAIYGTSGAGKSFISSILSKEFSKSLGIDVSLIDMDVQNPSVDIFNSLDYNQNGLSQIIEDVDKKEQVNKLMDKYMIKDRKNKKLWYMTNNASLFDIQNKFSNKYYSQIYTSMLQNYDYTIVDLPSSPFLDVVPYTLMCATTIFFVLNPNYISVRQAIKYLELLNRIWDIPKNKINVIINKTQKNSLDKIQIESLLSGYNVVLSVDYTDKIDSYINGAINDINLKLDYKNVYRSLNITRGRYGRKNKKKNTFEFDNVITGVFDGESRK